MTPLVLNQVLFGLAVVAFAYVGFSSARRHRSAADYFHNGDLWKNVVSLTATTITLGTGLVYLISGAQQNGLISLFIALSVYAGFALQAWVLGRLGNSPVREERNMLAGISDVIAKQRGVPSLFAKVSSVSLIFVFVLVLSFEIFASSKVVAPLLFETANVRAEAWLSVIIFAITVCYTIIGGVSAVFSVDKLQVPLVAIFIVTITVVGLPEIGDPGAMAIRLSASLNLSSSAVVATVIACIGAVATQLYSILNWGAVSHVAIASQQKLLRRVGLVSSLVFALFILIGLLHPKLPEKSAWDSLMTSLTSFTQAPSALNYIVSGSLVLGMASILLTTTDAIVISAIMFWYDNVSGGNSKSGLSDPAAIRRIRLIGVVAFTLCFVSLMAINYLQPDPFYLLLSMAGGVTVFAPMIAVAVYLLKEPARLRVFSNEFVWLYFSIFAAAGVIDVVLLWNKSSLISYVAGVAFLLSCAVSAALLFRSRVLR